LFQRMIFMLAALMLAPSCFAQKISPVISQFSGKQARGQLTVTNNDLLRPESVVIEAKSFSVVDGKTIMRPLDSGVSIQLSQTSARLAPAGDAQIDYALRCAQDCAVVLLAEFSGLHITSGIAVGVALPNSIYFCKGSKASACRARIRESWGVKD
jgi:hypothetical protein